MIHGPGPEIQNTHPHFLNNPDRFFKITDNISVFFADCHLLDLLNM